MFLHISKKNLIKKIGPLDLYATFAPLDVYATPLDVWATAMGHIPTSHFIYYLYIFVCRDISFKWEK